MLLLWFLARVKGMKTPIVAVEKHLGNFVSLRFEEPSEPSKEFGLEFVAKMVEVRHTCHSSLAPIRGRHHSLILAHLSPESRFFPRPSAPPPPSPEPVRIQQQSPKWWKLSHFCYNLWEPGEVSNTDWTSVSMRCTFVPDSFIPWKK